jgi:uracil-DNA glycosylase family 4
MTIVPGHGPLDAEILWVGEAPGEEEERDGKPFVGRSGIEVRKALRDMGIDPESVRYTNACRHNPGPFPVGHAGALLLKQYADDLDAEMRSMPRLRVIVACGGPACTRLTGRRSIPKRSKKSEGWGIDDWRGSVFRNADIPDVLQFHGKVLHPTYLPERVTIIPVLHPAGILRDPGLNEMFLFRRDVQKVKHALHGTLAKHDFYFEQMPSHETLRAARKPEHTWLYFDTEFDHNGVYWIGLTFDSTYVYGMPWLPSYAEIVAEWMADDTLMKGAHNIHADARMMERAGLTMRGKWWDTMIGFHALHPALDVGLDDAARYYIDDVKNWKDMATNDPYYNALDVAYGARVMLDEWKEAKLRPVNPLDEMHERMALLKVTQRMEERGMRVDIVRRNKLVTEVQGEQKNLETDIATKVAPIWDSRVRTALQRAHDAKNAKEDVLTRFVGRCEKHPTYNGIQRSPARTCDQCQSTGSLAADLRASYPAVKKEHDVASRELERWEKGFDAGNNEHLRWLLYDPYALRLPVQKDKKSKRPTANRAAIDKLKTLRSVQARPDALAIVDTIKKIQHLAKAASTFLFVEDRTESEEEEGALDASAKIDAQGYVHPPYKVHGTRTGRLAGGKDDDEKSDNTYAFNPMNIPREWRVMYVPPDGHCFVESDWRNVEGRLTALFCKDPLYNKVLAEELTGGPKVHAVNAGIIYNIDPRDAEKTYVEIGGVMKPAYDGGKRLTHAWSYGMGPPHMSSTFNIKLSEAVRIDTRLREAYPILVGWREQLVDDTLGVWESVPGERTKICVKAGRRLLANPFGWQMHFMGREARQANEVIAFLPQSSGAGMWTRVAPVLEARYPLFTGTYDSFVMIVPDTSKDIHEAAAFIKTSMERTWPQLANRSFPCEVSYGWNWGKYHPQHNPRGLRAYEETA